MLFAVHQTGVRCEPCLDQRECSQNSGEYVAGTIVSDVEGYIFNNTEILKMLVSNALVQCGP